MANAQGNIRIATETEGSIVRFYFKDKRNDAILTTREYDVDALPEEIKHSLTLYGVQKAEMDRTSDFYKAMQEAEDPEIKAGAMDDVWALFLSNQWKAQRSSGKASQGYALIVKAVARVKKLSLADAQASWDATDEDTREKIKASQKIKEARDEIKEEEKTPEVVDLSDLS